MTYNDFKKAVIDQAKSAGISQYDLYYHKGMETSVYAYEGDIENFSDQTSIGACFRCIIDGKMGYSSTQSLTEEEAVRLVKDAQACAEVLDQDEYATIFEGSDEYAQVEGARDTGCDVEALKKAALEIERMAKAMDSRIKTVPMAVAGFGYGEKALYNSSGLDLGHSYSCFELVCEVTAEDENGRKYEAFDVQMEVDQKDLDVEKLVKTAVDKAIGSMGASSVKSGEYPIVFQNDKTVTMLGTFGGIFSGDSAQKGLSLLGGKEGEKIASGIVTLLDDPHHAKSIGKTPFDDEGVATRKHTLIENGILKTLLYDLTSAAKAGKATTGNGVKGSYGSSVQVSSHNLVIEPGSVTKDELLKQAGNGLYITELKGMHASANASTGDFSLEAKGYVIEDGRLTRPAEQFTIAGNFYKLLENITGLANDFYLHGGVGAPAILVSSLAVAGEE